MLGVEGDNSESIDRILCRIERKRDQAFRKQLSAVISDAQIT